MFFISLNKLFSNKDQTIMEKLRNLQLFFFFKIQLLFFALVNCFAQSIPPQELYFIKDYQTRNFYNSQVILSQLDFSKKILDHRQERENLWKYTLVLCKRIRSIFLGILIKSIRYFKFIIIHSISFKSLFKGQFWIYWLGLFFGVCRNFI